MVTVQGVQAVLLRRRWLNHQEESLANSYQMRRILINKQLALQALVAISNRAADGRETGALTGLAHGHWRRRRKPSACGFQRRQHAVVFMYGRACVLAIRLVRQPSELQGRFQDADSRLGAISGQRGWQAFRMPRTKCAKTPGRRARMANRESTLP